MDPRDPTLRAVRSDILIRMQRLADSIEDLRAVWQNNPSTANASRLMLVYKALGRLDDEAEMLDAQADNIEPAIRGMTRKPGGANEQGPLLRNLDRLLASGELAAQHRA